MLHYAFVSNSDNKNKKRRETVHYYNMRRYCQMLKRQDGKWQTYPRLTIINFPLYTVNGWTIGIIRILQVINVGFCGKLLLIDFFYV